MSRNLLWLCLVSAALTACIPRSTCDKDCEVPDTELVDTDPLDSEPADTLLVDTDPVDTPVDSDPTDACPATHVCLPAVPTGWTGPIALRTGSPAAPLCPASYPTQTGLTHAGLQVTNPDCSCLCSVDDAWCELESSVTGTPYRGFGDCNHSPQPDLECLRAVGGAYCVLDSVPPTMPTPTWATDVRVCGGGEVLTGCEADGLCAPRTGDLGLVCIERQGEHACPPGYPDRTLYHNNFTDTRSCEACSCDAIAPTCEFDIEVCSVAVFETTVTATASCLPGSGDGQDFGILADRTVTAAGCTAVGGALLGTVGAVGERTVCCP
jgi:hypothetical protein